ITSRAIGITLDDVPSEGDGDGEPVAGGVGPTLALADGEAATLGLGGVDGTVDDGGGDDTTVDDWLGLALGAEVGTATTETEPPLVLAAWSTTTSCFSLGEMMRLPGGSGRTIDPAEIAASAGQLAADVAAHTSGTGAEVSS